MSQAGHARRITPDGVLTDEEVAVPLPSIKHDFNSQPTSECNRPSGYDDIAAPAPDLRALLTIPGWPTRQWVVQIQLAASEDDAGDNCWLDKFSMSPKARAALQEHLL